MTDPTPQPPNALQANKPGAPPGNRNSIRHGLRASRLPPGCSYIIKSINKFREHLEDAVLAQHGEVSLMHAALIHSTMRAERHAQLCQRWMVEGEGLTPEQMLAFSRDVMRASLERDRCLKSLGLDRDARNDLWSIIDAEPSANDQAQPNPPPPSSRSLAATSGGEAADCGAGVPGKSQADAGEGEVSGEGDK